MISGGGGPSSGSANGAAAGAAAAGPPGDPCSSLAWNFSQVFGERMSGEEIQEVDIISAIEFDKTGDHLATGDRGGRVVLFDRSDDKELKNRKELEKSDHSIPRHPEYRYSTEFQSHEPEFDYLKSLEIEEKINKIRWCHTANGARFVLSTNDKTIKLWKITEKKLKRVTKLNVETPEPLGPKKASLVHSMAQSFEIPPGGIPSLHLPKVSYTETAPFARCRRVYANAHTYHINSISNNSDCETYISADDLRINLWNMEISDLSFNIVDIKPANMEDLTEVITSAEFHPFHCNTLAYSSSKGSIRLVDMRQSALCDRHSIMFEEQEAPATRSFFTEIVASISDIKFARSGRYILSRDYMTLKLWDVNMNTAPVVSFKVHEYLRPKLCDLYENDSLFDKFECCLSGDGLRVATGSYSNLFRVFGVTPGSDEATTLECTKTPNRRLAQTPSKFSRFPALSRAGRRDSRRENGGSGAASGADMNGSYDFSSKLLHLAWHPCANLIACAASNSLYMYYA